MSMGCSSVSRSVRGQRNTPGSQKPVVHRQNLPARPCEVTEHRLVPVPFLVDEDRIAHMPTITHPNGVTYQSPGLPRPAWRGYPGYRTTQHHPTPEGLCHGPTNRAGIDASPSGNNPPTLYTQGSSATLGFNTQPRWGRNRPSRVECRLPDRPSREWWQRQLREAHERCRYSVRTRKRASLSPRVTVFPTGCPVLAMLSWCLVACSLRYLRPGVMAFRSKV